MSSFSFYIFQAKQGLGDYLSHLARASQVQRLLERYIALAPVFIGGPSSTSLDLLPPPPSAQYSKAGLPSGPWEGLGVNPPPLVPIGLHQQQHNGHLQVKKNIQHSKCKV